MKTIWTALLLTLAALNCLADLRVPGFTAYLDPVEGAANVSEESGVTGWASKAQSILWFGQINTPGDLQCAVLVRPPDHASSKLRLTVAGQSREVEVKANGAETLTANFGTFSISTTGYVRFKLESLLPAGQPAGDVSALVLDGPASVGAHFNLKSRRNAASVHLAYPVPKGTNIAAFYCEVTGIEDPLYTYYMACGWHRGYFGMQVNGLTERRIIFSVWDSGKEAVDRAKVAARDRVSLIAKGEGVDAGDFGNEGTGGHSHLVFPWKTGERQRFLVTACPVEGTFTIYSGYFFRPDQGKWMLISSWKTPRDGAWLHGLYSFSENFGGDNGHLLRNARFGNQWIRTDSGDWIELVTASFSHDPTGRADRLDRFMGVEQGEFFLSHGGFVPGFTKFGEKFTRPPTGKAPSDLVLPELPEPYGKK